MHTQQEINIWKERINSVEFLEESSRIKTNANTFLKSPLAEIWKHNLRPMTEQKSGTNIGVVKPLKEGINLRDAAFLHLLGETKYYTQIKNILLKQISEPSVNFSDRSIWVLNIGSQPPMFHVAEWVTTLLHAYEYSKDIFSETEQDKIEDWFLKSGKFFNDNINNLLDKLFVDRKNSNYSLSGYTESTNLNASKTYSFQTHIGGRKIAPIAAWNYQNRQSSQVRTIAEVGFLTGNEELKKSSHKYVREAVMFWAFPDGLTTEFERGFEEDRSEAGFYYSFTSLELLLSIADLFARNGDTSLFDFKTSKGWFGTEGGEKSLWKVANTLCKIKNKEFYDELTKSNKIYSVAKQDEYLIDGFEPLNKYSNKPTIYAKEFYLAQYNVYFNDPYIKESYLKSLNTSYYIATSGIHHNDQGVWGVHPSKRLMYWGMEGRVNPYGAPVIPPIEEPINENLMKLNYIQITATGTWERNDLTQVTFSNKVNDNLFHTFIVEKKSTVKVTLEKLHTHGIALLKIGSEEVEVDLYSPEKVYLDITKIVDPGQVSVQIFVTGKKNSLSSNTWVVFKEIELIDYVEPEVDPETPPTPIKRYRSVRKGNFRIKINGELTSDNYTEERTAIGEATFLKYSKPSDVVEVIPPVKYVIE